MTVHENRTRLEWAEWFRDKGIAVFIIEPMSKRALGGHSWYIRNTHTHPDPDQLAEWFDMTPGANYGLWLGESYVVIDIDTKHDSDGWTGVERFESICLEHGMPDFRRGKTLKVRTPSGGWHLFFKTPFKCANKNSFPPGIDVRGAVGYVVGPCSKIAAGAWRVVNPGTPIADLPEWLAEYMHAPGFKNPNHDVPLIELDRPENIEQALAWLQTAAPAIEGENGDDRTYDVCCMLRDFGVSETEALNILNESGWNERCAPAWESGELEVKIRNSYAFGQNRPGCKAESYERSRLMACRPTPEQLDALGRDGSGLRNVPRSRHRKGRRPRIQLIGE